MHPRALCSLVLMLVVSTAFAGQPVRVTPGPVSGPVLPASPDSRSRAAVGCATVYYNLNTLTGVYSAPQREVLDDLHLASKGSFLCGFSFTYGNGSGGPTDVTVTFYANDGPGGRPGSVVAGPYFLPGLPVANHAFSTEVLETSVIGPDLWMGLTFSAINTGLFLADPPSIGSSQDLFYQRPDEAFMNFGGNPIANFALAVEVDTPTPARTSTWGSVKTLYR